MMSAPKSTRDSLDGELEVTIDGAKRRRQAAGYRVEATVTVKNLKKSTVFLSSRLSRVQVDSEGAWARVAIGGDIVSRLLPAFHRLPMLETLPPSHKTHLDIHFVLPRRRYVRDSERRTTELHEVPWKQQVELSVSLLWFGSWSDALSHVQRPLREVGTLSTSSPLQLTLEQPAAALTDE